MRKSRAKFFLILPLLLSSSLIAGEIKGVVRDAKTNMPLADTTVAAMSDSGQGIAQTDSQGNYTIPNLPAGTYTVQVAGTDSKSAIQVTVTSDGVATQAFAVAIAGDTVEITGSRIKGTNVASVSPVTSVGDREIAQSGSTSIENVVSTLPQAFITQGSTISNGSTGRSNVSLRGLGSLRNLVLVNGRRVGSDLNVIPTVMVDRIDVLTGGASSVYGADAVAGVVNFVMKKDFEGVLLDFDWSMFQHTQSNQVAQDTVIRTRDLVYRPLAYNLPGDQWNLNLPAVGIVLGSKTPDGKGHVSAYGAYRNDQPIFHADRDFSSCALYAFDGDYYCLGSATAEPTVVTITGVGTRVVRGSGNDARFIPYNGDRDTYNFAPLNYLRRPDERYQLGAFARYEIEPWAKVYTEAMYMNDRSVYQIAPGGFFRGSPRRISCSNPLLSEQQIKGTPGVPNSAACPGYIDETSTPGQTFLANIGRRNIEGGPRNGVLLHNTFRYLFGLEGEIAKGWNYDTYMSYMSTDNQSGYEEDFHRRRAFNAVDVVPDTRGNAQTNPNYLGPVCRSVLDGTDPNCVPYNVWSEEPISQAARDYVTTNIYGGFYSNERIVDVNVTGDLGVHGIIIPTAKDGVALSLSGQWRRNEYENWADDVSRRGDSLGAGGATVSLVADVDVFEAYTELQIPLVQGVTAMENVVVDAGYRFSHYSFKKDTHTFKFGLDWEFVANSKLRASYQRAVRAPTLANLYSPPRLSLGLNNDPCAGLSSPADDVQIARCAAAFGLTAQQVLSIEKNPANQYWVRNGGNPNLDVEKSDSFTVGLVSAPDFIPGLTLSVDYYSIAVDDAIGSLPASLILSKCLDSANPNSVYCKAVVRDPVGRTLYFDGGYVDLASINIAKFHTSGLDFYLGYRLDTESMGTITMSTNATLQLTYFFDNTDVDYDCVGYFGGDNCGSNNPAWRHLARVSWQTPVGLTLSGQWRFITAANHESLSEDEDLNNPFFDGAGLEDRLGGRGYLDLSADYKLFKFLTVSAGVNNVFDTDPPLWANDGFNGNVDPLTYDALGRYIYMSAKAEF